MILYQLRCADEHAFEAWFRDSATYDKQAASGHVECPYCGSTQISKAPMAPNIAKSRGDHGEPGEAVPDYQTTPDPVPDADVHHMSDRRAHEVAQQILDAVGRIRDYAEENFEDVGEDFADEARKIHHGEAEERGIYGQASEDEANELEDEGIDIVRLPGTGRRNS